MAAPTWMTAQKKTKKKAKKSKKAY